MPPPSQTPPPDNRPVVAIYRSPLFNASESFVQAHAAGLVRYRPVFVGVEDKGHAWPSSRARRVLPASRAEALRFRLFGDAGPLAARLHGDAPCLVHAHFATDGLLALPLARRLGAPLVTTLHGYDVGRSRLRLLLSGRHSWMNLALRRRRLAESGDLFLAVSDAVRARSLALGFPAERTLTHRLGVDLACFRPEPGAAEPGLILHVGRLVEKKGTRVLIEALARLRPQAPQARLVVVGDGPERPALERQCAALGLAGAVHFTGAATRDEVAAWLRRAWLLAVPSLTARDGDAEGLPTVLLEAAASGLPAVGSDHAGIPEAIVDGKTGFVVPERDPAALAARLADLLGDGDRRYRMGVAARSLAEASFDAARQAGRLEELYDALLGQIRA
ncbi:MAG: glycosyltransferase [Allosphingosinicella sp.]